MDARRREYKLLTGINVRYVALLVALAATAIIALIFHNLLFCLIFIAGAILGVIKYDILSKMIPYITASKSNKKVVLYVVLYYLLQFAIFAIAFFNIKTYFVVLFLFGILVVPSALYISIIKKLIFNHEEYDI